MTAAEYHRAWYERNREKKLAARKAWYWKNKERRLAYDRERYSKMDSDKKETLARNQRARALKSRYNISLDQWNELFVKQGGRCALCKRTEGSKSPTKKRRWLYVDHCHDTGRVRGLLCVKCNVAIGSLGDNVEGIQRALQYVQGVT